MLEHSLVVDAIYLILPHVHQLRAQAERMAINMPIQGTDADLMKRAMMVVDRELPPLSIRSAPASSAR